MSVEVVREERRSPKFIVVEGPVGVGKTSLAKRLALEFDAELVLEQVDENPFLDQFYESQRKVALPAQLFFLFQRARQLELLTQSDMFCPVRVADFHVAKDRLFASINLSADEMALYEQIYERLDVKVPQPDLVIYLQASTDVLLSRITQRGIDRERFIDRDYIERVGDAYARFFHDYDDSPLLIINASIIDPAHNDSDFSALFAQVQGISGGRHFFNPAASAALA